jgi:hypothetical protein
MVMIRTPAQRVRVFISSTIHELADERRTARDAVSHLRLIPVFFEAGERPHPPRDLYSAYRDQSHNFLGSLGWVAPGAEISGLEEFRDAAPGELNPVEAGHRIEVLPHIRSEMYGRADDLRLVGELVARGRGLKVLVTSRTSLHVRSERMDHLATPGLPEDDQRVLPKQRRHWPATQRFAEPALEVKLASSWTGSMPTRSPSPRTAECCAPREPRASGSVRGRHDR